MKILFFIETISLAHIGRSLKLCEAMLKNNTDLIIASDEKIWPYLTNKKITFENVSCLNSTDLMTKLESRSFIFDDETIKKYIEVEKKLIKKYSPDLVIGDFRLSLSISCRWMKVPYVNLTNSYWLKASKLKRPTPSHPILDFLNPKIRDPIFSLISAFAFKNFLKNFNSIRVQNGQAPYVDVFEAYTDGDYRLFLDTPLVSPLNTDQDQNNFYLGPALWSLHPTEPPWKNKIEQEFETLVYFSMGNTGQKEIVQACLDVFLEKNIKVIISTAGRYSSVFDHKNIFSADYLDAQWACANSNIVITNGGTLGSYLALSEGKPVLGISNNMDQELCMSGIEYAKAGIHLKSRFLSKGDFSESIDKLLEKPFQISIEKVREEFSTYALEDRWQAWIKSL